MKTIFDIERIKIRIRNTYTQVSPAARQTRSHVNTGRRVHNGTGLCYVYKKEQSQEYEPEIHRYRDLSCL